MFGFITRLSWRVRLVLIVAIILIALVLVVPLYLGCQTGIPGRLLSFECLPGVGGDSYDIVGEYFSVGRLATWHQSLSVRPNNVVTIQIDGTLDLANATNPRTFEVNDVTLVRGGGVIRAGGAYSTRQLMDGLIFGSGILVLDGSLRFEASDLSGSLISMNMRGSHVLINDHVTLNVTGTDVTGIHVHGDLDARYLGEIDPETPTMLVQGSASAVGAEITDGLLNFGNIYLRVEGSNAVGVKGDGEFWLNASQVEAPDGVAIQMVGDGLLSINPFSRIVGGVAAIQGDDGAQGVDLNGAISGDIDLGDGADRLHLHQFSFLRLENGAVTMGAGNDTLTLDYSEGVIDTPLDGGDGTDTLVITLHLTPGDNTPTEADIAAAEADGELALPAFTLRWTNFENVQIAYAEDNASS